MNTHQDRPSARPQHPLTLALGIVLLIFAVPLAILGIVAISSGLTTSYERITPITSGAASATPPRATTTSTWPPEAGSTETQPPEPGGLGRLEIQSPEVAT